MGAQSEPFHADVVVYQAWSKGVHRRHILGRSDSSDMKKDSSRNEDRNDEDIIGYMYPKWYRGPISSPLPNPLAWAGT